MSNNSIYVIGDVHGCIKTLKSLIAKLPQDAKIVFVGDLIDRGASSMEVVDFVMKNNYDCVLGNHEDALLEFEDDIFNNKSSLINNYWVKNYGGHETLKSYGIFGLKKNSIHILKKHITWIKQLPLILEYPYIKNKNNKYLVVSHSAISDKWELKDSSSKIDKEIFKDQVLFSRDKFIYDNENIYNIFGHTPVEDIDISSKHANIDTGCIYNYSHLLGKLSAIEFPSMKVISQINVD